MLSRIWEFFFGKSLSSHLEGTKTVRVNGVKFIIKKIDALNYLDGSNTMRAAFDAYKNGDQKQAKEFPMGDKKVREYFANLLVNSVVSPRLTHREDEYGIWVEKLFVDIDMVMALHNHIIEFTYGKKKMKLHT